MKLTKISAAILLAGLTTTVIAAPDPNTPYIGAKAGWSHYFDLDFTDAGENNFSRNHLGAGAFGGYQFTPNIGVEVGYDWLGRANYSLKDEYTGKYTGQGLYATGKFSYEVVHDFDVYTRLGVYGWRSSNRVTDVAQGRDPKLVGRYNSTGVSPVFAAGVEYALSPSVATRLDYQYVPNLGKSRDIGMKPDNGMLSVGLSYRFGQGAPAPVVAPTLTPVPETKKFNLRSDVLFAFGKSELKAEGREALKQLFSELQRIDPDEGKAVVIGFTDRIGSAQANQALSERRAQSVVNELIGLGVPANLIEARGMGAQNPVTGSQCDNVSPRSALIECLGPDRRVEIQVTGLKTAESEM
ncbi:porin OmpA [Thorsellia kenyensis]|uniref:Outer membrane protein A n=1 Tax=Thorsellia kenyensis TaxID=1549888 RepID=A0ABV6C8I6_9GAMM